MGVAELSVGLSGAGGQGPLAWAVAWGAVRCPLQARMAPLFLEWKTRVKHLLAEPESPEGYGLGERGSVLEARGSSPQCHKLSASRVQKCAPLVPNARKSDTCVFGFPGACLVSQFHFCKYPLRAGNAKGNRLLGKHFVFLRGLIFRLLIGRMTLFYFSGADEP